jgi:two-component system sensor histidine kinase UhpB
MLAIAEQVGGMGSWEWDLESNQVAYSANALQLYGIAPEEYDGNMESVFGIFHSDDLEMMQQSIKEMLAEKKPRMLEYRIVKPDGTIRIIEGTNQMFFNDRGEITHLVGHIQDITERRRGEEALRDSEEQYRLLITNIPDVVWLSDFDGKPVFISPVVDEVFGYSPEEVLEGGRELWYGSIHPDDLEQVQAAHTALAEDEAQFDIEYRVRRKDGEWIWIHDRAIRSYKEEGTGYAYGMFSDITDRKRAEKALGASEQRFREMADLLPQTVYETNLQGQITFANEKSFESFGYTMQDLDKGLNTLQMLVPEDRERAQQNIKAILSGNETGSNEYTALRKDGTTFPVLIYSSPICMDKAVTGLRGIIVDITERKATEEKIVESERFLLESQEVGQIGSYDLDIPAGMWTSSKVLDDVFGIDPDYERSVEGWAAIIHPEWQQTMVEYFTHDVLEQRGRFDKDYRIIRQKDGAERWVHGNGELSFDSKGNPIRMIGTIQDITSRKQAETDLQNRAMAQEILLDVSQSIASTLDLEEVLQTVSDGAADLLKIETTAIYLLDEEELYLGATTPALDPNMPDELRRARLKDHSYIQKAVTTRLPVILPDAQQAELTPEEQAVVDIRGLRSLLYLPLIHKEEVTGVLILGTITQVREFSEEEIGLLRTVSNQLVLGIQNARLHTEMTEYAKQLEAEIAERKLAEKQIEESEERYRTLSDAAFEGIVQTEKGIVLDVNQAILDILGYEKEELIGKPVMEFVAPEDRDLVISQIQSGDLAPYEHKALHKDGSILDVVVRPRVLSYQGRDVRLTAIRDVTKRKQAEESLRESEEKFSKAFQASPDAMSITTAKEGIFLEVNEGYERVTGHSPEDLLGHKALELNLYANPDDRARLQALVKEQGRAQNVDLAIITRQGEERLGIMSMEPIDVAGEACFVSIFKDITDLKHTEEALRESESKYRSLFDHMHSGFALHEMVLDDKNNPVDYLFLDMNDAFEKQTGLKKENVIGKPVTEVLPGIEQDETNWIQRYGDVAITGESISFESYAEPLGRWYSVIAYSPGDRQFATLFHDITDRKRIEEALRESEEMYRNVVDGASVGMVITEPETGEILYSNPWEVEMLGYGDPAEFAAKPATAHLHEDELPRIAELVKRLEKGESMTAPESYRFRKRNGDEIVISAQAIQFPFQGKNRILSFHVDITNQKKAEDALQALATTFSAVSGTEFLEQVSRHLAATLGVDFAFIGELIPGEDRVQVVAGVGKGQPIEPFAYDLADTPCANVMGQEICYYPSDVQELFPKDLLLVDMGIESYIGSPLFNKTGNAMGIIVCLDSKPLTNRDVAESLFAIFTERVSAELERKRAEDDLRDSEKLLREMAANYPNSYVAIVEKDLTVGFISGQEFAKTGGDPEQAIGLKLEEVFGAMPQVIREKYQRTFDGEEARFEFSSTDQHQLHRTVPLLDALGEISQILLVVENITRHKQAEESMKQQTESFYSVFTDRVSAELERKQAEDELRRIQLGIERSGEVVFRTDLQGAITYVNPAFEQAYGYSYHEVVGQNPRILKSGEHPQEAYEQFWKVILAKQVYAGELINKTKDGRLITLEVSVNPILDQTEGIIGFLAIQKDITDRKEAEAEREQLFAEISESQTRLKALSSKMVKAQEDERRHIARELHDEIGQVLTAVRINLQRIQKGDLSADLSEQLERSLEIVEEAQQRARSLSLDLRPAMLDDLGLTATLRWYLDQQSQLVGYKVHFDDSGLEERPPTEVENVCFRIVQEALTNTAKYANASNITVILSREEDQLHISIHDDGKGFDVEQAIERAKKGASLGLLSMQERAGLIGGDLVIESESRKGTTIRAIFPCN